MDVTAEDLQNATNGIINDLLVKTMNQGALIEAQAREIAALRAELDAQADAQLDQLPDADEVPDTGLGQIGGLNDEYKPMDGMRGLSDPAAMSAEEVPSDAS